MTSATWNVAAASVRGKGHEDTDSPCQDACSFNVSSDSKWVALVASDGAGTASRSEVGSSYVATQFSAALIGLADKFRTHAPGAWVTDAVIEQVVKIRAHLRDLAGSDDISQFHCTLVAALVGPSGGFAIHLGDGALFCGAAKQPACEEIDLSADYFVSKPENGEYSNETVFLTERDWIKHLRITPLGKVDWIVLGTDGGMALAMVREKVPKTGFVAPMLKALQSTITQDQHTTALRDILADKKADRLTNDDKSLIVAVRRECVNVSGEFRELKVVPSASTDLPPPKPDSGLVYSDPRLNQAQKKKDARTDLTLAGTEDRGKRFWWTIFALVVVVLILLGIAMFAYSKLFRESHSVQDKKPDVPNAPIPSAPASRGSGSASEPTAGTIVPEVSLGSGQASPPPESPPRSSASAKSAD